MPDMRDNEADEMVRGAFRATARPAPSPYFESRLRVALAEERSRRRAARARMRIMQAYWVLTAVAALCIVALMPWEGSANGVWLSMLLVTGIAVLPAMLVRIDLIDLIVGSARRLGDHS